MRIPRPRVHHFVAGALLVVLGAASALLQGPERGQVPADFPTTYSTEEGGLRGIQMVLEGLGFEARRYEGPMADLDPARTPALAVVGGPRGSVPLEGLGEWVEAGGSLLLATWDPVLLRTVGLRRVYAPRAPVEEAEAAWAIPGGDLAADAGFDGVPAGGRVHARLAGGAPFAVSFPRGRGRVVAVADPECLRNRRLAEPRCAVLATRLLEAASVDGRIDFCETLHGFGGAGNPLSGFRRILLRTPLGHAVLGAAAFSLLHLLASARRFGRIRRDLEPPRRSEYEYLDALAGLLRSSRAWHLAGRLVLRGLHRRVAGDVLHRRRATAADLAGTLSWSRPGREAAGIRAAVESLAGGTDPDAMTRAVRTLDPVLPARREPGDGAGCAPGRREHAAV